MGSLHYVSKLQVKKAVTKPSLMDWKGVTAEMVGKVKELRNDENGKEWWVIVRCHDVIAQGIVEVLVWNEMNKL